MRQSLRSSGLNATSSRFGGGNDSGRLLAHRSNNMADCQKDASRFYKTYRAINPDDPSSRFIIGCMAVKGYDFMITPAQCSSEHPLPPQTACYEFSSWLFWIIEKFRAD